MCDLSTLNFLRTSHVLLRDAQEHVRSSVRFPSGLFFRINFRTTYKKNYIGQLSVFFEKPLKNHVFNWSSKSKIFWRSKNDFFITSMSKIENLAKKGPLHNLKNSKKKPDLFLTFAIRFFAPNTDSRKILRQKHRISVCYY